VTARASEQDCQECRDAGMDEVITKPVSRPVLDRMLRRHLEGTTRSEPRA
jgi:CheY-like chemotaxis protein